MYPFLLPWLLVVSLLLLMLLLVAVLVSVVVAPLEELALSFRAGLIESRPQYGQAKWPV